VSSLVKKWKRAVPLYKSAEEAFTNLSSTTDPVLADKWRKYADNAKANRQQNVKAMDYFQVHEFPGKDGETTSGLRLMQSDLTCSSGSCPDTTGIDS
jgi:hypothetical protein